MPPYDDTCVLCGRKASVIDAPELNLRRFKCSEENGCTTFEIGGEAEAYIQDAIRLKDRLLLFLSRAARRSTTEGNGPLLISDASDMIQIAAKQEGWERSQK